VYGTALLLPVLLAGAVAHPLNAVALLVLGGGTAAVLRRTLLQRVGRRRTRWTVDLPGTQVRVMLRVCRASPDGSEVDAGAPR
jgi:hypothetical protein